MKLKISLAALVLGAVISPPVYAVIDGDSNPRYAGGTCLYHGYVLEISCDLWKKTAPHCQVDQTRTQNGKKVPYPQYLPGPDVVLQPPKLLYCIDPPEKKQDEKKPFLCC